VISLVLAMFVPQVIKSARVMKKAVLRYFMEAEKRSRKI
jgi:cobalamin-dependent methionine synthase I